MTTSVKKVIAYHISRLQDKSRDVRLKSITELSHMPAQETFEALQLVFEKDEDHEVRKAAQEAGRAVFLKLQEMKGQN